MSLPLTEKLIQRQINQWNRFREFLKEERPHGGPTRGPVITVSRLAGSGGRMLASALADRLGLELHDQSLVETIARDQNLSRSLIAQLDENAVSQANLWVTGVLNQRLFMKDQYHMALVKTITALAARGGVVILGRGANLILCENATLRVRVVAAHRTRVDRLQSKMNLSRAEARTLLDETDRRRTEFVRSVFKVDPGGPQNFDLTINSDRFSAESLVEQTLLALLARQTETFEIPHGREAHQ